MNSLKQSNLTAILIEDLVMRMASAARINVAKHSLLTDDEGVVSHHVEQQLFGRRKKPLQITDIATLIGEREGKISCEELATLIAQHSTAPKLDTINLFERLYFCWMVGDATFGVERLRLAKSLDGFTSLAPSTRFTSSQLLDKDDKSDDELSILINSKCREISHEDFIESMQHCGIERKISEKIVEKFANMIDPWCDMIESSTIDEELGEQFKFMLFLKS